MPAVETIKEMKEVISIPRGSGTSRNVEFGLYAPEAKKVYIAGKFNDWNMEQYPMKKGKDGYWRIKIKLSTGTHEYKYFVDGAWAQDVSGAALVPNPFGTSNCVISVK
jgi:1,4-alpha-glucan branching enzyme